MSVKDIIFVTMLVGFLALCFFGMRTPPPEDANTTLPPENKNKARK